MCGAGCGLIVRVMQGEAEVVRNGQTGVVQMGLAKKLEGNPDHPVNQRQTLPARAGGASSALPSRPPAESAQTQRRARLGPISGNYLGRGAGGIARAAYRIRSAQALGALAFLTRPLAGSAANWSTDF